MAATKAKIEKLARALFPRYGIHDVVPPAGGPSYGTGNPWRHGPAHDAVEKAARWRP